jgi:hypothetical protein
MIGHRVGAGFIFLLGIIGIWLSKSLPVENSGELGTKFFPLVISILLLGLSIINLVNIFWKERKENLQIQWPQREGLIRLSLAVFLFLGYVVILESAGYMISTFLLILLFARLVFNKSWVTSGTLSILAVLSTFGLLSTLLGVRLPGFPWRLI